ncbi:MAG TPA: hypothetical protein VLY21_01155 [Nitrososphaerales archaeon]|nr:hypothetical protein [Nitrososphaerales archaeon]
MKRGVSSQVTGAALLVVGLVIGAGLVFASTYVYGIPSAKTVVDTSTQSISVTSTSVLTQSMTQTTTVTSTTTETTTSVAMCNCSSLVSTTISIAVPTGEGPGTMVVSIKNNGSDPIAAMVVTYPTKAGSALVDEPNAYTCLANAAGATPCSVGFTYDGDPIDEANPLPVGAVTSASIGLVPLSGSTLQAGTTYSFLVIITFANGGTNVQIVSSTAQL